MTNVALRQFSFWTSLAIRTRTMTFLVRVIRPLCIPTQISQPIAERIAVVVASNHAARTWPNEGPQNYTVHTDRTALSTRHSRCRAQINIGVQRSLLARPT